MRTLLCALLLLTACMPAVIRRERAAVAKTIVVEDSLLQLTAYYLPNNNWRGEAIITLKNVSTQTLEVQSTLYLYTVDYYLQDRTGKEPSRNKVCSWARETPTFKKLQPGEILCLKAPFPLAAYYSNLPAGNYTAWATYRGTIKNAAGGYLKSKQEIRSAPVQVQIEAQPKW